MPRKPLPDDPGKKARRRARVRIGAVKPSHPITPKAKRKPKHKLQDLDLEG